MWSFLIAPAHSSAFTVAALVMLGLLAVEIVTAALFGVAASSLLDSTWDRHRALRCTAGSIQGVDGPLRRPSTGSMPAACRFWS